MNYIKRLQAENEALRAEKAEALERLTALLAYLGSAKFDCGQELDGYVHVRDVAHRLQPAISPLFPMRP